MIATANEYVPWVVSSSSQIMKGRLNFATKSWLTLVRHRLGPTIGDNTFSPNKATLIVGILEENDIDIAKIITCEIQDRVMSTGTSLAFLCLMTKICLDNRVPIIPEVDNFTVDHRTIDLGLIRDQANPISRIKISVVLLQGAFNQMQQWTLIPIVLQNIGTHKMSIRLGLSSLSYKL